MEDPQHWSNTDNDFWNNIICGTRDRLISQRFSGEHLGSFLAGTRKLEQNRRVVFFKGGPWGYGRNKTVSTWGRSKIGSTLKSSWNGIQQVWYGPLEMQQVEGVESLKFSGLVWFGPLQVQQQLEGESRWIKRFCLVRCKCTRESVEIKVWFGPLQVQRVQVYKTDSRSSLFSQLATISQKDTHINHWSCTAE